MNSRAIQARPGLSLAKAKYSLNVPARSTIVIQILIWITIYICVLKIYLAISK